MDRLKVGRAVKGSICSVAAFGSKRCDASSRDFTDARDDGQLPPRSGIWIDSQPDRLVGQPRRRRDGRLHGGDCADGAYKQNRSEQAADAPVLDVKNAERIATGCAVVSLHGLGDRGRRLRSC